MNIDKQKEVDLRRAIVLIRGNYENLPIYKVPLIMTYIREIECRLDGLRFGVESLEYYDLGVLRDLLGPGDEFVKWFIGQTYHLSKATDYDKETKEMMAKYQ